MRVLLHVCCAPDATVAILRLKQNGWEPILYFYNPNIEPCEEFKRRFEATEQLARAWNLTLITDESGREDWKQSIKGLEDLGERSRRCEACIAHRLQRTAQQALQMNIRDFCTTLTTSPKKNSSYISAVGSVIARNHGLNFLMFDFKKQDGFRQSVEMSKKLGLYRQNYCGCIYSLEERVNRSVKR